MAEVESEWPFGEGALDFEFVHHSTNRRDLSDDEFYNDGYRHMNDEEWVRYCRQVDASGGFDVDDFPDCIDFGIIIPVSLSQEPDTLQHYTDFAITTYNTKKKKNLKLVEFIKWNQQGCSPMNYYITFKAEDGGKVDTYQAMVVSRCPDEKSYVETFWIKPEKGKGIDLLKADSGPEGKGRGEGKGEEKGKGKGKGKGEEKGKAVPVKVKAKGKGKGKEEGKGKGKGKEKEKGKADPDRSWGKGRNKGHCC